MKQNYKGSLKVINAKISTLSSNLKTPVSQISCLTERINKMISPTINRKQLSAQRKVISIDLKMEKKQSKQQSQSKHSKKVIKVRRKTQSVDAASTKQCSKAAMSVCSSQKKVQIKDSKTMLNSKLRCFDEVNTCELEFKSSRKKIQYDWEEIVENKKHQLYSQLYKMDKKIFALERDLDQFSELSNKKTMIQIIKKKTAVPKENCPAQMQIQTNVYKLGKNRAMRDQ